MERFYRRHMPHFRGDVPGSVYFVTWRLASDQPALSEAERDVVASALRHWDGIRCNLLAFVVMDDHVHVLLSLLEGTALERLLQSWKGFTGHRLVKEFSRKARVWQQESYDHVVRNDKELEQLVTYIADNPQKRWPEQTAYAWLWTVGSRPSQPPPEEPKACDEAEASSYT